MLPLVLAATLDEFRELPKNARRLVVSIARAAELDSIVEVQGLVIERLCSRVVQLEARVLDLEVPRASVKCVETIDFTVTDKQRAEAAARRDELVRRGAIGSVTVGPFEPETR